MLTNKKTSISISALISLTLTTLASYASSNDYLPVISISNCAELQTALLEQPQANYELSTSFSCEGYDFGDGLGFMPIGSEHIPFTGSLDGNGHTISHLHIHRNSLDCTGLFGYAVGGTIKNLSLTAVEINGHSFVGGLIGCGEKLNIEDVNISGKVAGFIDEQNPSYYTANHIGGLIGHSEQGSLYNISTDVEVSGTIGVSGIAGYSKENSISDILVNADILGYQSLGGVVGYSDTNMISHSDVSGMLTATLFNLSGYAGGLVGYDRGSSHIFNTHTVVTIRGEIRLGGLVGYAHLGGLTVTASSATGEIIQTGSPPCANIGGLIGTAYSTTIVDSAATTNVIANTSGNTGNFVGGLVGSMSGAVYNSYAEGTVIGYSGVGGLYGYNNGAFTTDSYATGSVSGVQRVGGLIGYRAGGSINNSYATGHVSGDDLETTGGLVGFERSTTAQTINNSYWNIETTGQTSSAGGGIGINTTQEMQQRMTYSGWDFWGYSETPVWVIDEGKDYPRLLWEFTTTEEN